MRRKLILIMISSLLLCTFLWADSASFPTKPAFQMRYSQVMPTTMAYSKDSKVMAMVYRSEIRLFEAGSGKLIRTLKGGHDKPIRSVAFSGSDDMLVSGTYGPTPLVFWNYKQGKILRKTGDKHRVSWLDFSPDGKWLAIAHERPAEIHIWNVAKNKLYKTIKHPRNYTATVRFTPDGKFLAAGLAGRNSGVTLFSVKSGRVVKRFRDRVEIYYIDFSPNGRFMAAGGGSERPKGRIFIYDLKRKRKVKTLRGHKSFISGVYFLPDGKHLISSSKEFLVRGRVWNFKRGKQIRKIPGKRYAPTLSILSPDGKFFSVKLNTRGNIGDPITVEVFGQ